MAGMMNLAGMRAMQITLVGTGGRVRTSRHPALQAKITKGSVTIAGAKAAGAMMIPAARRTVTHRRQAAEVFGIARNIYLAGDVRPAHVYLAELSALLIEDPGTPGNFAFMRIAHKAVLARYGYAI